jgi:hypothetical protein
MISSILLSIALCGGCENGQCRVAILPRVVKVEASAVVTRTKTVTKETVAVAAKPVRRAVCVAAKLLPPYRVERDVTIVRHRHREKQPD